MAREREGGGQGQLESDANVGIRDDSLGRRPRHERSCVREGERARYKRGSNEQGGEGGHHREEEGEREEGEGRVERDADEGEPSSSLSSRRHPLQPRLLVSILLLLRAPTLGSNRLSSLPLSRSSERRRKDHDHQARTREWSEMSAKRRPLLPSLRHCWRRA